MCDESNVVETIKWILDKSNKQEIDKIRKNGMELVRNKHTTNIRSIQFNTLIEKEFKEFLF